MSAIENHSSSYLLSSVRYTDVHELPLTFLAGGLDAALPIMVIACKTDLEARILPDEAQARIVEYNVGIVEVTVANKIGREKMRTSISFLFSSMKRARQGLCLSTGMLSHLPNQVDADRIQSFTN